MRPLCPPPRLRASVLLLGLGVTVGCRFGYEILLEDEPAPADGSEPGTGGMTTSEGGASSGGIDGEGASGSGASSSGGGAFSSGGGGPVEMPPDPMSCFDGVQNGEEEQIDCGGSLCKPCCNLPPFEALELVLGLEVPLDLYGPSLSRDARTLYFAAGDGTTEDLYTATRSDRGVEFSAATALDSLNTDGLEGTPWVTADDQSLYFYSNRSGTQGSRDLMVARRSVPGDPFGVPDWLVSLNSTTVDQGPSVSPGESTIVMASLRAGGAGASDLWVSERPSTNDAFPEPVNLTEINTASTETGASLSGDGLTLYFISDRPGSQGNDVWTATRDSRDLPFEPAVRLDAVSTAATELDVHVSFDERELLLSSNQSGTFQLYRAFRDCD